MPARATRRAFVAHTRVAELVATRTLRREAELRAAELIGAARQAWPEGSPAACEAAGEPNRQDALQVMSAGVPAATEPIRPNVVPAPTARAPLWAALRTVTAGVPDTPFHTEPTVVPLG
jgi:hypothetical protein